MPTSRFEPSSIKNKHKREEIAKKNKKAKNQFKLQKRLAQAKLEANDPALKKVCSFYSIQKVLYTHIYPRNVSPKTSLGPSTIPESLTLLSSLPILQPRLLNSTPLATHHKTSQLLTSHQTHLPRISRLLMTQAYRQRS